IVTTSDAQHPLYSVDVSVALVDPSRATVHELSVDAGVLAIATGLEPSLAYLTTADGRLLYWELTSNKITQTVTVGRQPVGLTLGVAKPGGTAPLISTGGGGTDTSASGGGGGGAATGAGATTGGGGGSGTTSSGGSAGSSSTRK